MSQTNPNVPTDIVNGRIAAQNNTPLQPQQPGESEAAYQARQAEYNQEMQTLEANRTA